VQQEDQQKADLDHRQQRIAVLHDECVPIERCGTEEDDQISCDVDDEIQEKSKSGNADEELRTDRRGEHADSRGHLERSLLLRREEVQVSISNFSPL
jgi:hypothetical protein